MISTINCIAVFFFGASVGSLICALAGDRIVIAFKKSQENFEAKK